MFVLRKDIIGAIKDNAGDSHTRNVQTKSVSIWHCTCLILQYELMPDSSHEKGVISLAHQGIAVSLTRSVQHANNDGAAKNIHSYRNVLKGLGISIERFSSSWQQILQKLPGTYVR